MKLFIFFSLFILFSQYSFSQTQSEMNVAANRNFQKADKELNQTYQAILTQYKSDAAFIKALKTSQRLWLQFMEAEIKTMYPDRKAGYYGSVYPMCLSAYRTELINERIKKLKLWLDGQEEGNSCSSSIKNKH